MHSRGRREIVGMLPVIVTVGWGASHRGHLLERRGLLLRVEWAITLPMHGWRRSIDRGRGNRLCVSNG